MEIKARYSGIWVDKDAFINLATLTNAAQRADEIGLGANWQLCSRVCSCYIKRAD